ncbi:MAG: HAMP domain-containing protein [Chloroflexi bacterium]|nr:HAMP domain-containing protein [Chloroflexota bacterium]
MKPLTEMAARLWSVVGAVSVRTKIMGIVLGLVVLLGLGITLRVRLTLEGTLRQQLEMRGISIARDLAARSTDLILTNNTFALHSLVRDTVENNEDLRYAFVVDDRGQVIAHSFDRGIPRGLREANPVDEGERYRLQVLKTEEGLVWDFAVPVFGGEAGVARVGLSEKHLQAAVASTSRQLLLATALASLVGIAAGYLLTWVLTRPVLSLVRVTQAIARGDLSQRAQVWADDEIGRLGAAFNAMVLELGKARAETEEFNRALLRRNRELAALNAVALAASDPLDISSLLERALQGLLATLGFPAGWVCLLGQEGVTPGNVIQVGLAAAPRHETPPGEPPSCPCALVLQAGRSLVISLAGSPGPAQPPRLTGGREAVAQAAVPLVAGSRILGVLSVYAAKSESLDGEELTLLEAIGRELGVAVENARLWEELRHKEALRGQLLDKVIVAQEEERKRVARELHDDTGQAISSLMIGLKVASETSTAEEMRERLGELRGIAAQTLAGVRDLARELRPSLLDDLGLTAALERYLLAYRARFGLEVDLQVTGFADSERLPPQAEITLYRIVQEALTNVAKHAQAGNVSVVVERRAHSVIALVEDDGLGFDVHQVLSSPIEERKLGLYGMQERASLLGGRLVLESGPGRGTTVQVEIPLKG